jgi:DNA-binding beta-propeller fold protein YncE
VIATSTNSVLATVPIPDGSFDVRVSPDGQTAYVLGGTALTLVSLATYEVAATVPLGEYGYSADLALSADGTTAYADGPSGVAVINTATHTVTRTLALGSAFNTGLAISPDNKTLYLAANNPNFNLPGDLSEVNLATGTITGSVTVGLGPSGVVLSADGSTTYVENGRAGTVSVVSTVTDTVTHTWTFGTGDLGRLDGGIFYSND